MPRVHWLGAGLSSGPGVRRLAEQGHAITLWNRTLVKAKVVMEGLNGNASVRSLDWEHLSNEVAAGDVVVSMLPAAMHLQVAELCLGKQLHLVCSSYVTPQMQSLSQPASRSGLTFLNEVGLDPGIDHLMAHVLVQEYQRSEHYDRSHQHRFRSYCGGLSEVPNDFRYKFSWSPLGVLKALKSRATWIDDGEVRTTECPWKELKNHALLSSEGTETFEAYPNRDSLPFMAAYGITADWNVVDFVRGTLRLGGWSAAWTDIFLLVDSAHGERGERDLAAKSKELWQEHQFHEGERDRVVLSVELKVTREGETVWHRSMQMDEVGGERGSAMSRLVSVPVSLGVEAVLAERIPVGVSAATGDLGLVNEWFDSLRTMGEKIDRIVHV